MNNASRRDFLKLSGGAVALSAASYGRVLGAGERIGIGFIGYGLIGKRHVGTFRHLANVDLLGVAEVHRGRREEGVSTAGRQAVGHADFRRLLDNKNIQAVIVATPDHWHALLTMLSCAAGKDVYVEKPLTLFVREGEWMMQVAAKHRRIVQVGTQQRSGTHYQRARELIRGGRIGQVISVRMQSVRNVMPGFGRPADCDPPDGLDWNLWLGPAPERAYNPNRCLYHFRWFWDYSGGQVTNLAAHHLDIVDWILGLDSLRSVVSVGGRFALEDNGETPDTQDCLFALDRCNASFMMRECSVGSPLAPYLEFYGTRGSLTLSRLGFRIYGDPDVPPANQVPGVREGRPAGGPRLVPARPGQTRTEPFEDRSGNSSAQYLAHARNFLDCIRSRQTPISPLESAQRVSVACHLSNLSLRLGRRLGWDPKTKSVPGDAAANRMLARPYRPPWDRELRALGVTA
jgi:predicted dehydrogenase